LKNPLGIPEHRVFSKNPEISRKFRFFSGFPEKIPKNPIFRKKRPKRRFQPKNQTRSRFVGRGSKRSAVGRPREKMPAPKCPARPAFPGTGAPRATVRIQRIKGKTRFGHPADLMDRPARRGGRRVAAPIRRETLATDPKPGEIGPNRTQSARMIHVSTFFGKNTKFILPGAVARRTRLPETPKSPVPRGVPARKRARSAPFRPNREKPRGLSRRLFPGPRPGTSCEKKSAR
jgi:hypothetical protein